MYSFNDDFLFGVATASYQIEGAWNEDGKGESIWDRFSHTPGKIIDGTTGDKACDHYHRMEEDIELLKELGIDAYRFSISWSRIFPEGRGTVNKKGCDFYQRLIDKLMENGIRPLVTLYHWDLPQALENQGGWKNEETVKAFADYAHFLFRMFGKEVDHWITHNEPWVIAFPGYADGRIAPGKNDFQTALLVSRNLMLSHGYAVQVFREQCRQSQIGIALNLSPIHPASQNKEDIEAAKRHDGYLNRWFLDPIFRGTFPEDMLDWYGKKGFFLPLFNEQEQALVSQPLDFLGINYYSRQIIANIEERVLETRSAHVDGLEYSDMGWEIYPLGMYEIVKSVNQEYDPGTIYITENGYPFKDKPGKDGTIVDKERIQYLRDHLQELSRSIEEGCPVKGYFVWSLLDNFEWSFGFSKRFGLVYVDYSTLERIPKESFFWYKKLARCKILD